MKKNYYQNQEVNKLYLKAYIYELIAFMHSCSFITSPVISDLNIQKIKPIVRYINENYKSPITLDDICNNVKYKKYTICHTFKNVTGSTIFEYINYLRIHCAIDRLKDKNLTILEISMQCGFSTVTYFNRVFKSVIGCSPLKYKKIFSTI